MADLLNTRCIIDQVYMGVILRILDMGDATITAVIGYNVHAQDRTSEKNRYQS